MRGRRRLPLLLAARPLAGGLLAGWDRRQVAVLVQVELAVLDAEHERVPFGLGEVQLARLRLGGVIHHVKLGLAGLVRRTRSVRGHVHLDPALGLLHGPRLLPPPWFRYDHRRYA